MADETNLDGQTFENRAATGSDRSRILDDGTYGENLPDPTEVRGLGPRRTSGGRLLPDLPSTELDGVNGAVGSGDESDSGSTTTTARKSTSAKAR